MTPGRKKEDFKIAWGKQKPHKLKIRERDMHKSTPVPNWLWLSTRLSRDSGEMPRAPSFSGTQSLWFSPNPPAPIHQPPDGTTSVNELAVPEKPLSSTIATGVQN